MKIVPMIAIAGLLASAAAFAAETPTPAPAATTPAAEKPDAGMARHASGKHCRKEAKEKNLTGKERAEFIKNCRAAKN
ncbi:MAG: PsiF family protein [Steroidobacteraceae bacterium]